MKAPNGEKIISIETASDGEILGVTTEYTEFDFYRRKDGSYLYYKSGRGYTNGEEIEPPNDPFENAVETDVHVHYCGFCQDHFDEDILCQHVFKDANWETAGFGATGEFNKIDVKNFIDTCLESEDVKDRKGQFIKELVESLRSKKFEIGASGDMFSIFWVQISGLTSFYLLTASHFYNTKNSNNALWDSIEYGYWWLESLDNRVGDCHKHFDAVADFIDDTYNQHLPMTE